MTSAVDVSDHMAAIAAASNRLTATWAGHIEDGRSTVLSGAGVWPLLGLLALGASGDTRAELAEAFGLDPALGGTAARGFVDLFDRAPALRAALGLWFKDGLPVREEWADELPPATRGRLTDDFRADQQRLNAWAGEHTDGLIDQIPVTLTKETMLVLASAILVTTTWREEFFEITHQAAHGPWAGSPKPALSRPTAPETIRVVDGGPDAGPITTVVVEGKEDIDFLLFLGGPDVPAGKVLQAGVTALGTGGPARIGTAVAEVLGTDVGTGTSGSTDPGAGPSGPSGRVEDPRVPGVVMRTFRSEDPDPIASLTTQRFTVTAKHDLLAKPALFGLTSASDPDFAEFPLLCSDPLYVAAAQQNAMAEFTAKGFKGAAVSAVVMARAVSMSTKPQHLTRRFEVTYDRPFGFAAVHRTSGLIIVAGWVAEV